MIQAMIFDLDGTLVQTERLKALSYARAVRELCAGVIDEADILEAFKGFVGLSRREVALGLVQRFALEEAARQRMAEFGVRAPWQAFIQVRLQYYEAMLADPGVLRDNTWPHNMALLAEARRARCKVGLATMSTCQQVRRVLEILELSGEFDFVASRDDVEHGKPDPEIYRLVASELNVSTAHCLVIEDSPAGIQAALAAGMKCIAVTTPFTRAAVHAGRLLDPRWIVDEPALLPSVVRQAFAEQEESA
jgi:beta-phosphoglucomutase